MHLKTSEQINKTKLYSYADVNYYINRNIIYFRARSVHFIKEEVIKLQIHKEKCKNIMMCEKIDGRNTKQHEKAWKRITKGCFAIGQVSRTAK